MNTELRSRLVQILSEILREPLPPEGKIERASTPRWDSLNHMRFIITAEEEFGVRFSTEEVPGIQSVDDVVALISKQQ